MGIRKEIPLYDAKFMMTDDNNSPDNRAVLFQFDKESGQTSFDVVEDVHMTSETPRLLQFEAKSMGRVVVGLFNKKKHGGYIDVTTLHRKK